MSRNVPPEELRTSLTLIPREHTAQLSESFGWSFEHAQDRVTLGWLQGDRVQVAVDALLDHFALADIASGVPSAKRLATMRRAFSAVAATP